MPAKQLLIRIERVIAVVEKSLADLNRINAQEVMLACAQKEPTK